MSTDPVAFLSYVRFDDQHNGERISRLREQLEGEIRAVTGRQVRILQDRQDIAWGNSWKQWIEDSLGAVAFLIPVVTPSFFQSAACRDEFRQFREREEALDRDDLILPLYYIDADEINVEAVRGADAMAVEIQRRQYADWRDLRHESLTSATAGKRLEAMARQIKAALPGVPAPPGRRPTRNRTSSADRTPSASPGEQAETLADRSGPAARNEPPTLVVDAMGRGDHATISGAIGAAAPGTRILVRPGYYPEGLALDKPLEILGDGPREEITVAATGSNVVRFETTMGRVSGLTLHQRGGGNWFAVDVTQGRLILENCDITSESLSCVSVRNGADPIVRGNRIHDGKEGGVLVHSEGRGTYEDNDVSGNALAGFAVSEGGDPVVRGNRIRDGKSSGVYVHSEGRGTYEDNDVSGNRLSGFAVKGDGDPVVRGNRITANSYEGIWVYRGGKGTYERNHLWDNARGSWDIADDAGEVTRRDNVEAAPS